MSRHTHGITKTEQDDVYVWMSTYHSMYGEVKRQLCEKTGSAFCKVNLLIAYECQQNMLLKYHF
ncbi:hypothetical protein STEG23_017099, partial [Scotinomys teguina]